MEVAANPEADQREVWTESVLGTLALSMHFHLQALFCHGSMVNGWQWLFHPFNLFLVQNLHLKDYENDSWTGWWGKESAEDSPNMHYNLCAYLVFSQPCCEIAFYFLAGLLCLDTASANGSQSLHEGAHCKECGSC